MACLDFINKCLQSDQDKRLKHSEILSHPWISGKGDSQYCKTLIKVKTSTDSCFVEPKGLKKDDEYFKLNANDWNVFN